MPLVQAIEHGTGQTESLVEIPGTCGVMDLFISSQLTQSPLERGAVEGDSPVGVI